MARRDFSFIAVVLAIAACTNGRVARPTPTIVVLEPGAAPRQRLRYEPPTGLTEEVETSTKLRITNTFTNTTLETGQRISDLPTSIIRGRLQVTSRSPDGHAHVLFAVEGVRTLEDVIDPRMRQSLDAQARGLRGAYATWHLLPSGEVVDVSVEMPNAMPAMRDHVSAIFDTFDEMFVRFPEADLGVGAIWQLETPTTISGVHWTRKATYTLRELTDGQATVDVSVALRAPSQDLRVEPNATTTLKSGEGTVSGQALVPLQGLVTSGSSQTTTEANFLIVRRHLRISSTLRTETFSAVKRIDAAPESAPVTEPPPQPAAASPP